jgi:hypothetical protein
MGKYRVKQKWAVGILICLLSGSVAAEVVTLHLKNGDKITGELVSSSTNEVVLTHPIFGRLTIPAPEISKQDLAPKPVSIPAESSQLPNAPVARASNTNAPTLPPGAFNTPSSPSGIPPSKPAKVEVKPDKKLGPKLWNTEIQFGLNMRYATKDQEEALIIAKTTYAKPPFRHIFDYNFNYGRTEGILSANKMTGSEKSEFDLTKRIYLFNLLGAGYDKIQRIDLQYEVSPGLGVKVFESTNFVLKSEIGITYRDQWRADNTEQKSYSGRLAELFTWRIYDKLTADGKIEFFPNLEEAGQYRFRLEGTLRYPLSTVLSFNLVVTDLYDTLPAPGVARNDLQIRSTIGLKF